QYMEIGKQYFELHKEDEEPFFEEISLIRETLQEISQLKSEIDDLKGKKKCPACGASLGQEDAYCNKCGAKCESIFEEEEVITPVKQEEKSDTTEEE
ncbi:MAG: zinc ribbon domain-containing protein, partial [Lachnospiraceae bacterium]|nr:zinc ribbon domain-containing protein [Lachnospiraceae bacterium]